MTEKSIPHTGKTTGDAGPYSSEDWARLWRTLFSGILRLNAGVIRNTGNGVDDALWVEETSPASTQVQVNIGNSLVKGYWYQTDAIVSVQISPNTDASGDDRIDLIILRLDVTNQDVRIEKLEGTVAPVPVAPTLTQTATIWEIPLAQIAVANSFVTIVNANIDNAVKTYLYNWNVEDGGIGPLTYLDDEFLVGVNAVNGEPVRGRFDFIEFNLNRDLAASRSTIAVTANVWATVPLNTEVGDTNGNMSLSSNQINIDKAGRYLFLGGGIYRRTHTSGTVGTETRIQNVTQAVTIAKGTGYFSGDNIRLELPKAWFEANLNDKIEIQIVCANTGTIDLGANINSFSGTNLKDVIVSFVKVRPLS